MKLRQRRSYRRGRIEIIPMIDVMFFLLATFMLASLAMQNLHSLPVDLPQGHAAPLQAHNPITLTITADSQLLLDKSPVTLDTLSATLKQKMVDSHTPIIVAADSRAPNGITVQAMLRARAAGAEHFLIAIKHAD
ncbi:MAG: biopolymer transporter ExbD [Ferrovum sp.]|nr:biopolymer transporter ExbD [Ferrovum sp.]